MSLDVFFRDDVRRTLQSLAVVAAKIPDDAERRGFALALDAVAVAMGVAEMSGAGECVPALPARRTSARRDA